MIPLSESAASIDYRGKTIWFIALYVCEQLISKDQNRGLSFTEAYRLPDSMFGILLNISKALMRGSQVKGSFIGNFSSGKWKVIIFRISQYCWQQSFLSQIADIYGQLLLKWHWLFKRNWFTIIEEILSLWRSTVECMDSSDSQNSSLLDEFLCKWIDIPCTELISISNRKSKSVLLHWC